MWKRAGIGKRAFFFGVPCGGPSQDLYACWGCCRTTSAAMPAEAAHLERDGGVGPERPQGTSCLFEHQLFTHGITSSDRIMKGVQLARQALSHLGAVRWQYANAGGNNEWVSSAAVGYRDPGNVETLESGKKLLNG